MFTIGTIASSIASPIIGKGFTKYPVKLILIIGYIVVLLSIKRMSKLNKDRITKLQK